MLWHNPPRVLVVEDGIDSADSLALMLRMWGYGAEACYDGVAALDFARTWPPHVVLLDIAMPRLDGFEVARRLRTQPGLAGTVLIALTGYGAAGYRTRAFEMGFDHFLLKPADPDELHELLMRVTGYVGLLQPSEASRIGRTSAACPWERVPPRTAHADQGPAVAVLCPLPSTL